MSFEIRIKFDQDLVNSDLEFTIDNTPVVFDLIDNTAVITYPAQGLLHVLRLTNHSDKKFAIQQVQIDGCDLRKLIYLSWIQNQDGQQFQPATEFWQKGQTWILPFGCPLSGWLEEVERKIPNDLFGKNLLEHFDFYFPESIELDSKWPRIIRDFYQHNFTFTVLKKNSIDPLTMPWVKYSGNIPNHLIQAARQEIQNNTDYIMQNGSSYSQFDNNTAEFQISSNTQWHRVWLSRQRQPVDAWQIFPQVTKLIDSLQVDHWYSFIGLLPPGGFIYPHRDYDTFKQNSKEYFPYQGCTQLYIPINWPSKNYIKFTGVGTLCLDSGQAMVINNDSYTHCLVNDSDQTRIVVGIRCHNNILQNSKSVTLA